MKQLIAIFFSIISINAFSQSISPELITTSGDNFKNSNVELDWSIGEIMIETYSNTENSLTQGFHQSKYDVTTSVDEISGIDFKIKIFPNPTSDLINLQIIGNINQNLTYELIDLQGKVLIKNSVNKTKKQINMSRFSQNMYLLKITTENGKQVSIFKIQKIN